MATEIVYFVHGTTTDNEAGIATGWNPGELSKVGISEARELGKLNANERFDSFFCSDLKRAAESAQLGFGDKYQIVPDQRLREINYGKFTGTPENLFKREMIKYINDPFPGGESYKDVEARVADFLNFLANKFEGKRVAILAHQAPQLALEVLLAGKTWPEAIQTDWRLTKSWQPGWEYRSNN